MELTLIRRFYLAKATIGKLFVDGDFTCFILEDIDRDKNRDGDINDPGEEKVYANTAIPAGRYEVKVTYSPKFKKELPELVNVPGFTGIRIHPGNDESDTAGCLLPGTYPTLDYVTASTPMFEIVFGIIKTAIAAGEKVFITIKHNQN